MQCLQPAFTLNYIKWSLLAGPGRTVGAVIASSLAAGDLLQALPTPLLPPCIVHLHHHSLPPGEKGAGQHTGAEGAEQEGHPKVFI